MLDSSKTLNLAKDIKIQKLTALIASNVAPEMSDNMRHTTTKTIAELFAAHAHHFSPSQLTELRSVEKGQRKDATFIAKCLEFLYDGETDKIAQKYPGNRKEKGKSMITPPKKDHQMEQLLEERVESEGVSNQIVIERSSRLKRLLGDGIYTLSKRQTATTKTTRNQSTALRFTAQIVPQTFDGLNSKGQNATTTSTQMQASEDIQFAQQIAQQIVPETVVFTLQPFDGFSFISLPFTNKF